MAYNGMIYHGLKYYAVTCLCVGVVWCALTWLGMGCISIVAKCCGLAVGLVVVSLLGVSLKVVGLGVCWRLAWW